MSGNLVLLALNIDSNFLLSMESDQQHGKFKFIFFPQNGRAFLLLTTLLRLMDHRDFGRH